MIARLFGALAGLLLACGVMQPASWAQATRAPTLPGEGFWEQIKLDDLGAIRFELGRGVDPNVTHPEFGPAIVHAARSRAFEVTRQFARMRLIRIDAEGQGGETALMLSALHGDIATIELLLQRGAQVNRPGWSPLHYAATGGQLAAIRLLVERHAFIDAESPNGTTPLMMAARMKQPGAARLLVELGADSTMRNQSGLDAAAYLQAVGLPQEAAWLREQALQFLLRYGSVEQARRAREATDSRAVPPPAAAQPTPMAPASGPRPSPPPAGPAGRPSPPPAAPAGRPSTTQPFAPVPLEREVLPSVTSPTGKR
jgi:hypothetical protein